MGRTYLKQCDFIGFGGYVWCQYPSDPSDLSSYNYQNLYVTYNEPSVMYPPESCKEIMESNVNSFSSSFYYEGSDGSSGSANTYVNSANYDFGSQNLRMDFGGD